MATEPFLINPRHARLGRRRPRRRAWRNPFGDELVVLGGLAGNPRRRGRRRRKGVRSMRMTHRTRRRRRRPAWLGYNEPRPRRRRRTRRRRRYSGFLGNPRRSRRRRYYRNAPGHRRRYRRNPNGLRLDRPMTWAPYLLTGAVAATATASLPRFFGPAVTAPMTYLIQGGIAIGGAFVFPMLGFRQAHGLVWFLVSGAVIAADFIRRWLGPTLGLAAYPFEAQATLAGMGQEPYYPPTLYPMYPAEPVEVGAYPYQEVGEYAPGPGSYAVAPGGVPYGE